MMRNRWRIIGLPLLVVIAGLTTYLFLGEPVRTDGPVTHVGRQGWADAIDVGEVFVDGLAIVRLSDGPVMVEDVRAMVDGPEDGLEFLGAYIAGPDRRLGGVTGPREFPPVDTRLGPLTPAHGATLTAAPHDRTHSYEFLLGFRATRPGRYVSRGVELSYTYAGDRYRTVVPAEFTVCVGGDDAACPAST